MNKEKVLLNITEILVGSGSAISSSAMGLINPGAGNIIWSSTTLLTSIATLITNQYISKVKTRFTKLRDWIIVITLLYEKTLKTSMVDKKSMRKKQWHWKKYTTFILIKDLKPWKILVLKLKMHFVML